MQDSLKPTLNYYETLSGPTKVEVDQLIQQLLDFVEKAQNMKGVSKQNERIQFNIAMSQFLHSIEEHKLIPRVRNAVREHAYKAWQERRESGELNGNRVFPGSDDELLAELREYQLPEMLSMYENGIVSYVRALYNDEKFPEMVNLWNSEGSGFTGFAKEKYHNMALSNGGNPFPFKYFKQVTLAAIFLSIKLSKNVSSR